MIYIVFIYENLLKVQFPTHFFPENDNALLLQAYKYFIELTDNPFKTSSEPSYPAGGIVQYRYINLERAVQDPCRRFISIPKHTSKASRLDALKGL